VSQNASRVDQHCLQDFVVTASWIYSKAVYVRPFCIIWFQ